MEKISEADLVKRIKALILQNNYKGAKTVISDIEVGRIKNPPILCLIGEVYMHEKEYEEAEEVLLKAYDRSPKNRKVLDLITSLYIEMGEYAEAEYYYKEFIAIASRDLHRYILRYRLDKGKGERLSVLIDTLERLKDYEYIEEWAYELAKLYDAAGDEKKCIHECDEIVLWFGHGEYVDKAIELRCKLTGEELPAKSTVEMQMAKDMEAEKIERIKAAAREAAQKQQEALYAAARQDAEPIELEAVKAAGIETKPVEESKEQGSAEHSFDLEDVFNNASAEQVIDLDIIARAMEENAKAESEHPALSTAASLFGAMNRAAQEVTQTNDAKADEAKDEAVENQAADEAIEAVVDLDEKDDFDDDDEVYSDDMAFDEQEFEALDAEDDDADEDDEDDFDEVITSAADASFLDMFTEDADLSAFDQADEEDDDLEPAAADEEDEEELLAKALFGDMPGTDMVTEDMDDDDNDDDLDEVNLEEKVVTHEDEIFLATLFEEPLPETEVDEEEEEFDEILDESVVIPQTVKDIFATVPNVKDVQKQLAMTFTKFETANQDFDILVPYDINFVVLSDDKGIKSQIAIGIAKALNTYGICDKSKIVRTKAAELNKQDFSKIFSKLSGGCLLIERADELSDESVKIIEAETNKDNQDVAIVLESLHAEMNLFWKKHLDLRGKFLNVINVSKYNETELVTLAKGYIEKRGYELSREGALELRNYFKNRIMNDEVINYEDVMSTVDKGITNLDQRNMKNLFMTVLDNKYEEAGMFTLFEEDFRDLP